MQLRGVGAYALVAVAACTLEAAPLGPIADAGDGGAPIVPAGMDASVGVVPITRCKQFSSDRKVFFGDLHVHTALSLDANLAGTRLRPAVAYRFARGEQIGLPPYNMAGAPARTLKLERPLDFAAVTDRAEYLGLVTTCQTLGLPGYYAANCVAFRSQPSLVPANLLVPALLATQGSARAPDPCSADGCRAATTTAWNELRQAAASAQDNTDACAFTSLVAYEWSGAPDGKSLRRNVIFASDTVPAQPFTYFDGNQEEQLWSALERDCLQTAGCDVLSIPHSANLSAGTMFEPLDAEGRDIDAAYAARRARFEPLMEVFQREGSSECLPEQGGDPLCAFELLPYNTLNRGGTLGTDVLVGSDYARGALAEGLALGAKLGANPFAFGFVAGTASNLGAAGAVAERGFLGTGAGGQSARDPQLGLLDAVQLNPGGLTAVWAEQNTRAALFAALKRREVYGTSGPRIELRMFGGFGLQADLCAAPDLAARGYAQGVPMGGILPGDGQSRAPSFAVSARRDPGTMAQPGGLLQRIQIIKGALRKGDKGVKFTVHEVAGAVGDASVDPLTCAPRGAGAEALCNVWTDPSFDPAMPAFYYARVLENPSCRWQARACIAAGIDCSKPDAVATDFKACCRNDPPLTQQERAWSSPIFYRPPT